MRTSASTKAAKPAAKQDQDVVMIHSATDDGGYRVIRQRDNQLEVGTMHTLKDGQPIHGEVVSLTPRPEAPFVCDVKVEVPSPVHATDGAASAENTNKLRAMPEPMRLKNGPAQVASDTYRRGWDDIWGNASRSTSRKNTTLN